MTSLGPMCVSTTTFTSYDFAKSLNHFICLLSVTIGGGRCTAARARNRPFERPTHATVGALGVVCANGCAGSPAQCHAWHADWWCPWPPPLRRWEARATRIGGSSSCRGSWDARANPGELTQRTALLNTSEPRRCTAVGRMRGGVTTELCYRLFDFLAQVLGSPLRRKSNLS